MYERFTDRARKIMQLANQEAQRFNHEYIGTEHILLGLVKEGSGVAAHVLKNLGIDLARVRGEVEKIVRSGPDMATMGKLPQTPRAKKVIEFSIEESRNINHNYVGTEHLLLGLVREEEGVASQVLMDLGLKLEDVRAEVLNLLGHAPASVESRAAEGQVPTPKPKQKSLLALALDRYGRDLTDLARRGKLPPVVGRALEMERIVLVLASRGGRGAALVGPHGVGRTALVHGLARLAASPDAPPFVRDVRFVELSLGKMVVGTEDRGGEFMSRVGALVREAGRARGVVLFLPDLFAFAHAGKVLAAAASAAGVECVTTATPETYQKSIADDEVYGRAFQAIPVEPPSRDEAVAMVRAHRAACAAHYAMSFADDAFLAAVALAERHLDGALPGKALRLLDQAAVLFRMRHQPPAPSFSGLDGEIERLMLEKEAAVAMQDFEGAAQLRDQADALLKEKARRIQEWQATSPRIAQAVDARAVEEVVSKITGARFGAA